MQDDRTPTLDEAIRVVGRAVVAQPQGSVDMAIRMAVYGASLVANAGQFERTTVAFSLLRIVRDLAPDLVI